CRSANPVAGGAVGDADAAKVVWQRVRTRRVSADEIALHHVPGGPIACELQPVLLVAGQQVPSSGIGATNEVIAGTGGGRDPSETIAHLNRTAHIGADVIPLNDIGYCSGTVEEDTLLPVAGNKVARPGRRSTNGVRRSGDNHAIVGIGQGQRNG